MEEDIQKISELTFGGIDYLLRLNANRTELSLQIEDRDSGEIWSSILTAEYIEGITQKANNFKKYKVFVKMLISAIMKSSESVSLEIISSQTMENIKNKKQNNNKQTLSGNINGTISSKKRDTQLKVQSESIEEIRYLTQLLEVKQRELAVLKSENAQLLEHAQSFEEMRDAVGKIKEGERVMFQQQQRMEQMDLEMSSILEELETYKKNDKKQKQRISVLEAELEGILARRSSSTQRTTRPRSSSTKNGHSNNQSGIGLASPLRNSIHSHTNSLHLLNSSGRQTPTNLSRNNSVTNLKRTPSKGSQMQHQNNSSLKRRNSIDSDTASSKARKSSNSNNNLRTYSPIRSSGGQSLSTKRTGNTPQKKTVLSSTGRLHSKSPSGKSSDIGKNSYTSFPSSSQQQSNNGNFTKNNTNNNSKKYLEKKVDTKRTISNNNNNNKQKTMNSESSDDESRLVRKLEELRSKNKENQENSVMSRRSRMTAENNQKDTDREDIYKNKQAFLEHSAASSSQCDNTFEITDKLTGLQELLRAAKNTKS